MAVQVDVHVLCGPATPAQWQDAALCSARQPGARVWPLPALPGAFGAARARGWAVGTAPWVAFVDDDDVLLPGAVAACLDALADQPAAMGAFTDELQVLPDGTERPGLSTVNGPWNPALQALLAGYGHHFVVLRRAALQDLLPELPQWGGMADYVVRGLVCRFGPLVRVPIVGYRWRVREASTHTHIAPEVAAAARARVAPVLARYSGGSGHA